MNAWPTEEADAMGPTVTQAESAATAASPPLKNGGELRETGYLVAVGSRTARFRRKHKNKLLLIIPLIIFVIIWNIVLFVIILRNTCHDARNLCTTKECLRSAANLALSMDDTEHPCNDFYQYVCGNWAEHHPRPDAFNSFDWFREKQTRIYAVVRDFLEGKDPNDSKYPKPVRQTKQMYEACMDIKTLDKRGLKHIKGILEELGLPLFPTFLNATDDVDYNISMFDWVETVIKVKTKLGMDVLIGFDIYTDPQNSSIRRIAMGSPEIINPFPSMHVEKRAPKTKKAQHFRTHSVDKHLSVDEVNQIHEKRKDVLIQFYSNLIGLFVHESDNEQVKNISESMLAERLLETSTAYYKFKEDIKQLDSMNETDSIELSFTKFTVNDIQAHTDSVVVNNNGTAVPIWRRYLDGVFNISDVKLDFDTEVIMITEPDLKYMSLMAAYVSKASPAAMELYIWIQVIEVLGFHTTTFVQSLYDKKYFELHYEAITTTPPRSLRCASTVNDMLGMAIAYSLVDPYFLNVTKPKIKTMLSELKSGLAHLVGKTKWMDDNTKLVTYRKIIEMKSRVGFPDWLLEEGKLELFYNGIEVDEKKYLESLISVVQAQMKNTLNDFHKHIFDIWELQPTEVNAFHLYQSNAITIPMVMLQYPFYNLGLESLNYGALATIIGHEITHGFDDVGRLYDKNGNIVNWWTNETIDSFVDLTNCFVEQFSSFEIKELGENIDGQKTLGENIADSGAVREAFAAFNSHLRKHGPELKLPGFESFTSEQMFFLSFANGDVANEITRMSRVDIFFESEHNGSLWCGTSTKKSLKEELEDDFHSPQRFRAIGSLQNTNDFAKTWNCLSGSNMNPKKKCVIF